MHAERDMIQNIVQPAVNIKLNEQGEYVSFSDLRWGINTISDSTKHRILDAFFFQITSVHSPEKNLVLVHYTPNNALSHFHLYIFLYP